MTTKTTAAAPYKLDYKTVKNWQFDPLISRYTQADVITYAKGIGVGMAGPLQAEESKYLLAGDHLAVLPTMAVVMNQGEMWTQDPRTGIDWTKTVHVEESITLERPIPSTGELTATFGVDEIYDKGEGKGALMYEHRKLHDSNGLVATVNIATYLRGNGGFGGQSTGGPKPTPVPDNRPADAVIKLSTPTSENTTYQLGPEFVEAVKTELLTSSAPMLRGVCSFGIAGRAVLKLTCDNQPARLRHLGLRYVAPVFCDETLQTEVWFIGPGKAAFRISCLERECLVMTNGLAEFDLQ